MRVAILSTNPELYSTRRLFQAGQARGHDVVVIDYLRCVMNIAAHRPEVRYRGEPLVELDAVIPRIGASYTYYGMAVVRQFEMMGVYSVAASQAIARSRDKLRCLQILTGEGVGLPVTGIAHAPEDATEAIQIVGGAPLVIKLLEGTQGIGVVLAETRKAAESVIEAFRGLDANILLQEFIAESAGSDIRAFVVGKRVVAAMKRVAPEGEFRANLHRGGKATKVKLTPEERSTAVRAAKAMGLQVSGVDILRSNHGPVVLEVNSSPGLEGIERASGVDVADRIYRHIEKHAPAGSKADRITT